MVRLTDRDCDGKIFHLAWPCILENLTVIMISFIDSAMIGSLGPEATAAVGVNASPSWLIGGLAQSLGVGGTALIARMIGAKDREGAARVTGQMLRLSLILSAFLTALMLLIAPFIPVFMNADAAIHADATKYMRYLALGFIPHYVGLAMAALMRGAGDTKTPMIAGIMSNILDIIFNFFLIYDTRQAKIFGRAMTIPGAGLGVAGAAIASAVATAISGFYLIYMALRKNGTLPVQLRMKWDGELTRRILRIAWPAALERASINLGQIFFARMVSSVGVNEFAAHNQSIQIESLGYMPAYGFSAAAVALVGQNLGANEPGEAERCGRRCVFLSLILISFIGVLMYVFAPFLISLLTPNDSVRTIGTMLIRICAFEQPFNAVHIVASGALRGAGDTRVPFYISLVSMWGVRIVFAYILGTLLGFGVAGFWWAMVADLGVRALLLWLRFKKGAWIKAKV